MLGEKKWFFHPPTPEANRFLAEQILLDKRRGFEVLHPDMLCADGKRRDLWEGHVATYEEVQKVYAANAEFGYKIQVFLGRNGNPPQKWMLHEIRQKRRHALLRKKVRIASGQLIDQEEKFGPPPKG